MKGRALEETTGKAVINFRRLQTRKVVLGQGVGKHGGGRGGYEKGGGGGKPR